MYVWTTKSVIKFPGPWALKHYQSLGVCKIYYSHFIFEVMYHSIWKLTSFACESHQTRFWASDAQSTHEMDPTAQTILFLSSLWMDLISLIFYVIFNFDYFVVWKNNNTRTGQALSFKFASVLFDQGFQIWVVWNWLERHLSIFCID